jgi:hypothetical protein
MSFVTNINIYMNEWMNEWMNDYSLQSKYTQTELK